MYKVLCTVCEGKGRTWPVHVLCHSIVDVEGFLKVGLLYELQHHFHVLLTLSITQTVLYLLQ